VPSPPNPPSLFKKSLQSTPNAFWFLGAPAILLALFWITGNIRPIPADSQVVILRFGRPVRVQQSGLTMALPAPLERVALLPGAAHEAVLNLAAPTSGTANLTLTADDGVVLLNAAITWRIDDATAYFPAQDSVPDTLRSLFHHAAIHLAASRTLDNLLADGPAISADIAASMNRALQSLKESGAPLGIAIIRADVTAALPPNAHVNLDAVRAATDHAAQTLTTARAEAARTRQQAETTSDTILTTAHASAEERIATARATTATITALEAHPDPRTHANLLEQLYHDRIGAILARAGSVNTVDAKAVSHLILPGAQ
jgi:modulator of FtsH protease HflK